ncbi:MAG: hypothetical protein ACFFD4_10735 [Candidatus Odinarchaeota archaeon]
MGVAEDDVLSAKVRWQQRRSNGLYCVGEKNKKGNANLRIHYSSLTGEFSLSVLADGGKRGERVVMPLHVPAIHRAVFKRYASGIIAYSVRMLYPERGDHVRVLATAEHQTTATPNGNGIASIDLNPAGISIIILYPNGNFRTSKWFHWPELVDARKDKRDWLITNRMKKAFDWISSYNINIAGIEDLQFRKKFDLNRRFNRIKSNFAHGQMITALLALAIKQDFAVIEVKPAFTSVLGRLKYAHRYGLNDHEAAGIVIGRRALGFGEKLHVRAGNGHFEFVIPPNWERSQWKEIRQTIDDYLVMDFLAHQGPATLDDIISGTSLVKKACISALKRLFASGLIIKKNTKPYSHSMVYWDISCSSSP